MTVHLIEIWPYARLLSPSEIKVNLSEEPSTLLNGSGFLGELESRIRKDVESNWEMFKRQDPSAENSPKIAVKSISDGGRTIEAHLSDYKTSLWIKQRLSSMPEHIRQSIADKFPILSVGVVSVTLDGYVLLEERPCYQTSPHMLLNYPCGYAEKHHKTLADAVEQEFKEEIGQPVFDGGQLVCKELYSLGVVRESSESSPNYVFMAKLSSIFSEIKTNSEISNIVRWPAYPDWLADHIILSYSPSAQDGAEGKLNPNSAAMLALYLKESAGSTYYSGFIERLKKEAEKKGSSLELKEYTSKTSPFR